MDRPDPLAKYIPSSYTCVIDSGPIHVYRDNATGWPVAVILGGHAGEILGGIVYYREPSDSMNMEIESPMEMMDLTMRMLAEQLKSTRSRDTVDGLWQRFMNILFGTLAQKRGFAADGSSLPVLGDEFFKHIVDEHIVVDDAGEKEEEEEPLPKRQATKTEQQPEDQEPTECMICLSTPPDTTVTPCLHSVVCAECSRSLAASATEDARVCCQCRQPITGVYYPDNSVDSRN